MTDHTRAMLEEAWEAIHRDLPPELPNRASNAEYWAWQKENITYWRKRDPFTRLLDAEAYLDAAVMLVPEGWNACIWTTGAVTLRHPVNPMKDIPANAETPALALLAAIMKAKNDE